MKYSFHIATIIQFMLVYLAITVETIGDNTGIAIESLKMDITGEEFQGAVHADGFGSAFETLFGAMTNIFFSQNIWLIDITKIVNRFMLMTGTVFLMLYAFIQKLDAYSLNYTKQHFVT